MIYGIGNDLVETERIKKSMDTARFLTFCFSAAEREAMGGQVQKLAGCFAAKEALAKALGTGVRGFSMDEISVLRDSYGKPYFIFEGHIKTIIEEKNLQTHLALTNTEKYVSAVVVLEVQA